MTAHRRTHGKEWEDAGGDVSDGAKQKKRRTDGDEDEEDDLEFEESVRTLTSLLGHAASASSSTHANVGQHPSHSSSGLQGYNIEPLETRVAAISAEIAAAIAQAQSRMYNDDTDDDDEGESGAEDGGREGGGREGGREREGIGLGPVVSGIRDEVPIRRPSGVDEDEEDFPVPLRARRGEAIDVVGGSSSSSNVVVGEKRKR